MAGEHIVSSFDDDLTTLNRLVEQLGAEAEAQLVAAVAAFEARDAAPLDALIARDRALDALEQQINDRAIEIIALRAPMAQDLRCIIAAIKVAAMLERVGDYAKNIAKRSKAIIESDAGGTDAKIAAMTALVRDRLHAVMAAYIALDATAAADIRDRDAEIDRMHTELSRELLVDMSGAAGDVSTGSHLLFIAKNIERIGDYAAGIAEVIHFLVHGTMPEDERPKADTSSERTPH